MKLYKIRDWEKHFEKAQNRQLINAIWVPIPTKHDGKTFRRIMMMPNGLAMYGAWLLMVEVAAKCTPRGTLTDDQGPLTAEDLAIKTGAPEADFLEALSVLSSERIGWLEASDYEPIKGKLEPRSSDTPLSLEPRSSLTLATLESSQVKPIEQIQPLEPRSSDTRATLEPHNTTQHNRTGQDNTQHNTGVPPDGAARVGVCVDEKSPPEITRQDLLAYAQDPGAGTGINHPQAWASARLADHKFDDEVRRWLERDRKPEVIPKLNVDACPDCNGGGFYYPNGIGNGPVIKCKHKNLANGDKPKEAV